jgi:hypothetical protein
VCRKHLAFKRQSCAEAITTHTIARLHPSMWCRQGVGSELVRLLPTSRACSEHAVLVQLVPEQTHVLTL